MNRAHLKTSTYQSRMLHSASIDERQSHDLRTQIQAQNEAQLFQIGTLGERQSSSRGVIGG